MKTNTKKCGEVTCPAGTHCGMEDQCIPDLCGNERVDTLEECDGFESIDQETLRCTDYGFYVQKDKLACSESCTIDTSVCSDFCGDFTVNGTERCDGVPPTGFACSDFGFDLGPIGCANGCTPAFDFCSNIGWQGVPGGAVDELYALYLASPASGVAVGRAGTVIAAKDGVWLPIAVPSDVTADLNGIYGGGTVGIFAVGNNGTILHYDAATEAITSVADADKPTTQDLHDVDGTGMFAVAVGNGGTIVRFDGTSWTPMTSNTVEDLYGVHVVGPLLAYAVGNKNTVLKWNGVQWSTLTITWTPDLQPPLTLFSVYVVPRATNPNQYEVFVSGAESTVARIVNDSAGDVLTLPTDVSLNFDMRTVWGTDSNNVYIGGSNGTILYWNGTYLAWQDASTNRTIFGLDGIGGRIAGVTRGGQVIAFNGTSRHVTAASPNAAYSIHTDGTRVVAAGNDVWNFGSDGRWRATPATARANTVFATGNYIFTGTDTSTGIGPAPSPTPADGLYRYNVTPATGAIGASPTKVLDPQVRAVWASSNRIVAVGYQVMESTDFSATTFDPTSTTNAHGNNLLRAVWAAPDNIWFAAGHNGTVIRRALDGTWTVLPTGITANLTGVWGTASDNVFVVGDLGTILHWNGTEWRSMYTGVGENLVSISGNTASDIYVTGTSFMRLHYDGISWSRMQSYGLDSPEVSVYRGTAWYVSGNKVERQERVELEDERGRCGDPFDNDSKDGTNCQDPDCAMEPQCLRGGACETLERVTCETQNLATSTFTGVARLNDLTCLDHSTPGPEASFRYVADTTGTVTVTVDDPADVLDLVVVESLAGHCAPETCQGAARGMTKSITFTAVARKMYYIVVDGPVGVGAPFTLSLACN